MNVLITGGCGFIGSNLVEKIYLEKDWNIDIVDDLSTGRLDFLQLDNRKDRINLYIDDFAAESILQKIKKKRYDFIFHLAAKTAVGYSVDYPYDSNDINVSKTLKLLEASRDNIKKFIFSSSSATYGDIKNLPTKESDQQNPNSPYGLQKLIIEEYLKIFNKLFSFPYISLRYFNVYGPYQIGNSSYSTAISAWLYNYFNNKPLRSDGDGEQSRDMCFVGDVANANIKAALSNISYGEFNVGSGKSISNNKIMQHLKNKLGNFDIIKAPERIGDVKHTLADISKAEDYLDYYPQYQIFEGLEKTIEWNKKYFSEKKNG